MERHVPPSEEELIAQAVAEGYPDKDETCPACGIVFKNFHRFVICNQPDCPMKSGEGTLFEQWARMDEERLHAASEGRSESE